MNTSKKIISIMIAVLMLTVCIAFTASAADEVITEASATFTVPTDGEYMDVMNPVSGDESKYTVEIYSCYRSGDGSDMSDTTPFSGGVYYSVRILFTAKEGYTFNSSTKYQINGWDAANTGYSGRLREIGFKAKYLSTPEGLGYRIKEDGTVAIGDYYGSGKDVVIPEEISGKKVTEIDSEVFYEKSIESVYVPANVTKIGYYAVDGCPTLESITVNKDNPNYASENGVLFSKDRSELLTYPDGKKDTVYSVPDTVKIISDEAFGQSIYVKEITIPGSVRDIAENAFWGCTALEKITVDKDNLKYESDSGVLFSKDKKFLVVYPNGKKDKSYSVPAATEVLLEGAFADNIYIEEVILPDGLLEIGYCAFNSCSALGKIIIPDSVNYISTDVLYGTAYYNNADNWENGVLYCGNHFIRAKEEYSGNYSIRPGTKTIVPFAFYRCENLTGIVIPDGVVYIGVCAFDSCKSLKSVTVPGSVKIIDENAFRNCTELEAVTVGSGVESIEYRAFYECESLKTVNLGKGLKELGYKSFGYCGNLESIVIPDGVETIDYFAFGNCTKLASVTLPDSVKIIRSDVFENTAYYNDASNWVDGALYINNHLIEADVAGDYTVKEGTKTIASEAFDGNTGLNSVTLPDSLIGIGGSAFAVTNISDISIPSGLEYLGWNIVFNTPYENNPSNWENGLMYIDNCLAAIDGNYTGACRIKEGTRLIAESLFLEDEGVTSVVIPEGITEISEEMFAFSNIKSVTLPSSIKSIGGYAFYGVPLEINYSGSENSWNKIDFGRYNADLHFVKVNFLCPHKGTMTYVKAKNATCTAVGKKAYYKCSDCGFCYEDSAGAKKISDLSKWGNVSALGHKWAAATCTKAKTCSVCKATSGSALGHKWTAATCTKAKTCSVCKTTSGKALGHTYKNVTTKATLSKNGKVENKCSVCGNVSKTTTIYYPKTIKLSATEYTYNKKVKTPTVTVKDSKGNTLKKDTDYTVSYEKGRKVPGKYTVKITFKGKYDGVKRLYFTIKPRVTSKITASQTTTTITLKWTAVTGADGYRVYKYNTKTKKYEKLKDVTKNTLKISKLKAGTAYKYKVRAFTKDDGTIYGSYSDVFETATKCKTPSIKKLSSSKKGVASLTWTNVSGESGYQVYYSTKKDSGYKKVASYKTNVVKGSKKKLKSGKKYYFKVRAYKKTASGTVYSSWSAVKSVKIK